MTSNVPQTQHDSGTVATPLNAHCRHCDAIVNGHYCSQCGQKLKVQRVSFKTLFDDVRDKVFDWEKDAVHTVVVLIRDPKRVIDDFLSGKHKGYSHPLSLLIAFATLSFLSTFLLGEHFWAEFKEVFHEVVVKDYTPAQMDRFVATYINLNSVIAYWLLALTLPIAALTRLLFFKLHYNVAEYWLMMLYAVAVGVGADAIISTLFYLADTPYQVAKWSFTICIIFALQYIMGRTLGGKLKTFFLLNIPVFLLTNLVSDFMFYVAQWFAFHGN